MRLPCVSETGIGTKGPKNPRRVLNNCLASLETQLFPLQPSHRLCGGSLMHSSVIINLMAMFWIGWMRTMGGSAHPLWYLYHFTPNQGVWEQKLMKSMVFTTGPSFQSSGKRSQIWFMDHSFISNHMNYNGICPIGTTTSRSMASCLCLLHSLRHISTSRHAPETWMWPALCCCSAHFWSDSTQLIAFGDTKLWPLYVFFGNKSKYRRFQPTNNLCSHVVYFQVVSA